MAAALCLITHTFIDAAGQPVRGVVVKFTPSGPPVQGLGFVSRGVTVVSDGLGRVNFSLMQGLHGTLALTHVPLVREVTVPAAPSADLFALIGDAPDPFEPIDRSFTDLPRSS